METVQNLEEAKAFFDKNPEGAEVIVSNEESLTKVVSSFAEAEQFYTEGEAEATDAGDTVAEATGTDEAGAETVGEVGGTTNAENAG